MSVSACAHFIRLSFVICLPYKSIRVNVLCISLIRIYKYVRPPGISLSLVLEHIDECS